MKSRHLFSMLLILLLTISAQAQRGLPGVGEEEESAPIDTDFPADILSQASEDIPEGVLVLEEPFDDENAWELYEDDSGYLAIEDGRYTIYRDIADNTLWGQNGTIHSDAVIRAHTEQLSSDDDNGYGIMCRASPDNYNAEGYMMLISGQGRASISKYVDGEFVYIDDWHRANAINRGSAENDLIAVCYGEYLALFANGELVAEGYDDAYSEGEAGFVAGVFEDGGEVEIAFDDALIWELSSGEEVSSQGERGRPPGLGGIGSLGSDSDVQTDEINQIVSAASEDITAVDLVLDETFDDADAWEIYDSDSGYLAIEDGRYILSYDDSGVLWGQDTTSHTDVIIQVDTEQLSREENNGYGIMCRADPGNTLVGYHLWISGDGYAAILLVTDEDAEFIAGWDRINAINTGRAENNLIAVCVGDYLALFVNGELAVETNDDTLRRGVTGLSGITFEDGTNIEIAFDNLRIWEAEN